MGAEMTRFVFENLYPASADSHLRKKLEGQQEVAPAPRPVKWFQCIRSYGRNGSESDANLVGQPWVSSKSPENAWTIRCSYTHPLLLSRSNSFDTRTSFWAVRNVLRILQQSDLKAAARSPSKPTRRDEKWNVQIVRPP